jgi:acyl dehydratase
MSDRERPAAGGLTDELVARAKELVGVWLRRDVHWPALYEAIGQHDIRRWAMYAVGDDNPLWCDETYGRRTIWGRTIAPPTFLYSVDTLIVAPGLPGIQWIHGGTRWRLHRPIRVGDTITARARLLRVEEKTGRRVPRFLVQTGEIIFTDQEGRTVARAENDILRVPRARSGQGIRSSATPTATIPHRYTDEEIAEIAQAYRTETRRGAEPRYWEDVAVGETLPTLTKGPLTLVDIMAFYAGRRNVYNPLGLAFAERERHPSNVYVSPGTNIPIHPAAGHFDHEIATEIGMPAAYDNGWMRANWVGHLLTNWGGDWAFVRALDIRLPGANYVGDLTRITGEVTDKRVEGSEHTVVVSCVGDNQRGERTTVATAVVRLPSRSQEDRYEF